MKRLSGISALRGAWLILAMLAVAMRMVIPPGVMIAPDHGVPLVICTGHGALDAGTQGKSTPDKPAKPADHECPFAGAALALAPERPWTPLPALAFASAPTPAAPEAPVIRPLAAPPPPSQGPPEQLA